MRSQSSIFTYLFLLVACQFCFAQSNSENYKDVKFSFVLHGIDSEESRTTFRTGEKIIIKASLENGSDELFPFSVSNKEYQYRFALSRVGEKSIIGYRRDKATILSVRQENPGAGRRMQLDPILPGTMKELETMSLDERYEDLEFGIYKLDIEYKSGKIIRINGSETKLLRLSYEVTFEIFP